MLNDIQLLFIFRDYFESKELGILFSRTKSNNFTKKSYNYKRINYMHMSLIS